MARPAGRSQHLALDARLVHTARCGRSPPHTMSLLEVLQGHSQSDIDQTVYYRKKKKGLMIWICPRKPTSSHTRANAVTNGVGKATAVPGEGRFPRKPFKQIWEEGSAVQEPPACRAPREAAVLPAPLPVIEISCLSLTNPLLFR